MTESRVVVSVRQPWASLIVYGYKTIENRSWQTRHRGTLYIHSATKIDEPAIAFVAAKHGLRIDRTKLPLRGIIGRVELVDIVTASTSPWFEGRYNFD